MKYQEWLINWLNNYIQPSSKQRTYTRYSEIVNQHIIPKLGEIDLNDLTPFTLQCFVTELLNSGNLKTGKGLSPNSVNAIITVMQNSLKTAYALGYMNDYTADKIKRPKTGEKKVECFSSAEQNKMEQYIMSKDKPKLFGVFLCLYTGLRIGELLALEWTDIDFVLSFCCPKGRATRANTRTSQPTRAVRGLQDSDRTAQSVTKATTGRGDNDTYVQPQVER